MSPTSLLYRLLGPGWQRQGYLYQCGCIATQPITNLKQLGVPAGALRDFFGPGTAVGILLPRN